MLTTLPPSCVVVMKSGNLNFLEPSGPLHACNGTALPFYPVSYIPFSQSIFSQNRFYLILPPFFTSFLTSCSLWFPFQFPALRSSLIPRNLLTSPNHRNPIASITSIRKRADSYKKLVAFYETTRCTIPLNSNRLGLGSWMKLT